MGKHQRAAVSDTRSQGAQRAWRRLPLALILGALVGIVASGGLWLTPSTTFLYQASPQLGQPATGKLNRPLIGPALPTILQNPIQKENALVGTDTWRIAESQAATTQIQGYASAESAAPGETLTFYVSTQVASDPYSVAIYRLGWYNGAGGRLMTSLRETGQAQGYYDWAALKLVGCASCHFDPATKLLDAGWKPSFQIPIPATWTTGLYVAKLTTSANMQAYVHFTVTGNPHADYVATMPDNTTEAYNDWGGYSLYHGPDGKLATRAYKVSLNRPALGWRFGYGAGLSQVIDAIRWLERSGYDLSYLSTVDLHEHPGVLLTHRAYLSLGHDEYWSSAMRDGVEQARDAGIGLAFFGANAVYWNVRYEPDRAGVADRVIVCYKDARLDPLTGRDNAHVTVEWRQPPLNRPENALVGIMYTDWTYPPTGWRWTLASTLPRQCSRALACNPAPRMDATSSATSSITSTTMARRRPACTCWVIHLPRGRTQGPATARRPTISRSRAHWSSPAAPSTGRTRSTGCTSGMCRTCLRPMRHASRRRQAQRFQASSG